jgi:hypothetical protein
MFGTNKILMAVLVLILLAGGISVYLFLNKGDVSDQIVCTMDAKMCPDGSAVGRTGPKCEFAPCPEDGSVLGPDFIRTGVITYNNPGQKPGVMYLVYEEPGKPALFKELFIDDKSVCGDRSGEMACEAISAPLGVSFGGKRVQVSGMDKGSVVLVRELKELSEN